MIAKHSPFFDCTARCYKRFELLAGRGTLTANTISKRDESLALQGGSRGGHGGSKTGEEAGPVGDNA